MKTGVETNEKGPGIFRHIETHFFLLCVFFLITVTRLFALGLSMDGNNGRILLAYSPDGSRAAISFKDGTIGIWDIKDRLFKKDRPLKRFPAHRSGVLSLSYSPGGDRILSTGFDGFLRVWDAETSLPLVSNFDSNAVLFSVASYNHRGDKIVSTSMLSGQIRVLDAVDGRVIWDTQMVPLVSPAAFSPDNAFVAVGAENDVYLLDSETGEIIRTFDKAYDDSVIAVSFSPDGKYIVSADELNVYLWDVERGVLIYQLEDIGGFVRSVAFSPDGRRIITATERFVRLWDAATGKRISGQDEYEWEISSAVFGPDGKPVAFAETSGYFLITDAETGVFINILYAGFDEYEFTEDEKKRLYSDFID